MRSQTGQQIYSKHMLSKISRSKGNQKIKFGQLTENKMRNIVLEKSCTKYGGEASTRRSYKKLKLNISLDPV